MVVVGTTILGRRTARAAGELALLAQQLKVLAESTARGGAARLGLAGAQELVNLTRAAHELAVELEAVVRLRIELREQM